MQRTDCRIGQRVQVDCPTDPRFHGKLGTIVKINSVNVRIDVDELPRPLVINPTFVKPYDPTSPVAPVDAGLQTFDLPPTVGTCVTVKGDARITGIHVVIGDTFSRGTLLVKVVKLGGGDNRYWSLPTNMITVMPLEDVKELLPA